MGDCSYLWSDKYLSTRQTWRSWFPFTTIFSLQKKKEALKLQPQFPNKDKLFVFHL